MVYLRTLEVTGLLLGALFVLGGGALVFVDYKGALEPAFNPLGGQKENAFPFLITGEVVKNSQSNNPGTSPRIVQSFASDDSQDVVQPEIETSGLGGGGGGSGGGSRSGGSSGGGSGGSNGNTQPNTPVTRVDVIVSGVVDLSGAQIDVFYDPQFVLTKISEGAFLDNGNPSSAVLLDTAITQPGSANGIVVIRMAPQGVSGSGTLVSLFFSGSGNPAVQPSGLLSDSNGHAINKQMQAVIV